MIKDKLKRKTKIIQGELRGWNTFAQQEGWLVPPDDYILYLPRPKVAVPGDTLNWHIHAENFDRAIKGISFKGKTVLDLAAGRTWSSKELALRGAKVTATDILVEDGIGLETAYRYFKHFKIKYDLVRCDMNDLPFADGSFDIVLVHASVHHSEDIQRAISEMRRVCKKDGLLIFSAEPVGAVYHKILNRFMIPGLSHGINETTPRLREWLRQFQPQDVTIMRAKQLGWRDRMGSRAILNIFGGSVILRVKNSNPPRGK